MKRNRILIIALVFVLFAFCIDGFLIYRKNHQKIDNTDTSTNINNKSIMKRYQCETEEKSYTNSENGISLNGNEQYSFFVMSDQSLKADISVTEMHFNTLEDLNTYYQYLQNLYSQNANSLDHFKKEDDSLTLVYYHYGLYGDDQNINDYLKWLADNGYSCFEDNLNEIESN